MQLQLIDRELNISSEERDSIDRQIDSLINRHKTNSIEICNLVMESITSLEASKSRSEELANKGIMKRIWGNLNGSNSRLQVDINFGVVKSQYAAQQTMHKLAEQNLLSFELLTVVNNNLNNTVTLIGQTFSDIDSNFKMVSSELININEEINLIYEKLINFFKSTKSNIMEIENRLDKVEQNVEILNWVNTLEFRTYKGIEYSNLSDSVKLLCVANDFYTITQGKWTAKELIYIKSALREVNISPQKTIRIIDFINEISVNDNINRWLLYDTNYFFPSSIQASINYLNKLNTENDNLVQYISSVLVKHNIYKAQNDLKSDIITSFVLDNYHIDISKSLNSYDLIIELLFCFSEIPKYNEYIEQKNQLEFAKKEYEKSNFNIAYDVFNQLISDSNSEAMFYLSRLLKSGVQVKIDKKRSAELVELGSESDNLLCLIAKQCNLIKHDKLGVDSGDISKVKERYVHEESSVLGQLVFSEFLGLLGEYEHENYILSRIIETDDNLASSKFTYSKAVENYATNYLYGNGVDQDFNKAIELYKKSADLGNSDAMNYIGFMYDNGYSVEQNCEKANDWYKKSAALENSSAMYSLGLAYWNGTGVKQDYETAISWFVKSTNLGNSDAMYFIGCAYANGEVEGINADDKKAVEWFEKAAEVGSSNAMLALGIAYKHGHGVDIDYLKSFEWFTKSAEFENSESMNQVALMYYNGFGVDRDNEKALEWFMKSAEQGNSQAMYNVGYAYVLGAGVDCDEKKANEWFEKSAEYGNSEAMYVMGQAYMNGDGVEKDLKRAEEWFKKSLSNGYHNAREMIKKCKNDIGGN